MDEDRRVDGSRRDGGADPLVETLFRATAVPPLIASAAPKPTLGTHSRAGNAMGRTRAALLSGAARAVSAGGSRITMSQVATCSGVAKATLYNHFRTREAVLAAVLEHEVTTLIDRVEHRPLDQALIEVAHDLSINPVLRALAKLEPATIAALARVDLLAGSWQLVHDAVATALARAGVGAPNVVLRWLASYVVTPASYEDICEQVPILLAGLPVVAEASAERTGAGREPDQIQSQSA